MSGERGNNFLPLCSVVICTRDRPEQLDQCLQAVARLAYPNFNVVVVDNAPSDERPREVAARRGAHYIVEPVVGLSRARNRGARECTTDIIAYLDDDAVPEPEWLAGLASEFADPQVMAAAGLVLPMRAADCRNSSRLPAESSTFHVQERRIVSRETPLWFELANFGGIGLGGNMAFRRAVFAFWPGFDLRLGRGTPLHGHEEHHAFFSLIDRGYRVVFTPRAVVRHPDPPTTEAVRKRRLKDLAASTAYITFLFVEEPRYRREVVRYVVQAIRGKRRAARLPVPGTQLYPRTVSPGRTFLAYLSGPFLYARSCFGQRVKTSSRA